MRQIEEQIKHTASKFEKSKLENQSKKNTKYLLSAI
jgi:hypothetical protein